jgi:hypothetical protein
MTNVGPNKYCAWVSDVEEILAFKTFKILKKQVAYATGSN